MSKIKVLCAFGVPDEMARRLKEEIGPVTILNSHEEDEIVDAIKDQHVFVVRSKPKVTPRIIENAPVLRVVARPGVGTDNIDKESCARHNVEVVNTPESSVSSVAEFTIGLAVSMMRHIYTTCALLKEGQWGKGKYTGKTVEGKTWGIIGFGGIGRRVAEIASAMRAEVVGFDPYVPEEEFNNHGARRVLRLEELLEKSDIVSLHVILNEQTRNLLSAEALAMMKKGAYIINTSRGKVIDQAALRQALEEGHIGGAALDVFDTEPPEDREMICQENLITTPHIGGSTKEAFQQATEIMIRKLKDLLQPDLTGPIGD